MKVLVPVKRVIDCRQDAVTANLGLGRKLNDEWSAFGIVDWTKKDGRASLLRPSDGAMALTLGAVYESGQINIRGGVQYKKFGDATVGATTYSGNSALTPFLTVNYSF